MFEAALSAGQRAVFAHGLECSVRWTRQWIRRQLRRKGEYETSQAL